MNPGIAVLASGAGSNLHALLDAGADYLGGEIAAVVSHDPAAGALERARRAGVPAHTVTLANRRDPAERRAFENRLLETLAPYDLDLIVLAGWMLILSARFLNRCDCPVINVHPALLDPPAGIPILRGAHAVRDAVQRGLPLTGATVHFVTPEVDAGPIILSAIVPVHPGDTEESLHGRLKPVEHQLLPQAIRTVLRSVHTGGTHAPDDAGNRNAVASL